MGRESRQQVLAINDKVYDEWGIKLGVTRNADGTFQYTIAKLDSSGGARPTKTA
jgi:hypothetical protein